MTQWLRFMSFSKYRNRRQDKYKRKCARLATMRAAKERKRQERTADGWRPEPKLVRAYPLEFGVRVKATGETHFVDLKSARHAAKALGLILKFCQ